MRRGEGGKRLQLSFSSCRKNRKAYVYIRWQIIVLTLLGCEKGAAGFRGGECFFLIGSRGVGTARRDSVGCRPLPEGRGLDPFSAPPFTSHKETT